VPLGRSAQQRARHARQVQPADRRSARAPGRAAGSFEESHRSGDGEPADRPHPAAKPAIRRPLLYLNDYDLRKLPLSERKALLQKIIAKTDIQFSESFEIDGREMYKHACKTGLEGVISKVRDSRYVSGRVNDWVKKTCAKRETLAIAGFALDGKKWDGIYLGRRKGKELICVAEVTVAANQICTVFGMAHSMDQAGAQHSQSPIDAGYGR
jgi:hypothetical protein